MSTTEAVPTFNSTQVEATTTGPTDECLDKMNEVWEWARVKNQEPLPKPKVLVTIPRPIRRRFPQVGRNQLCPCRSGRKFKHCHGRA